MYNVLVTGAGKIGSLIACMLASKNDYFVHLADINFEGSDVKNLLQVMTSIKTVALDVKDSAALQSYIQKNNIIAVVSSLPYFLNVHVAKAAKASRAHYFDLTEDTQVTHLIKDLADDAQTAFVPQCGLAPGFISIAANSLIQDFEKISFAKLRVGALPQVSNNSLHYSLTWSTDGLINEYGNACHAIENGKFIHLKPLGDLETIQIEGAVYEAFNTSGGLGSLSKIYQDKIECLNYKTIRYPGHCEKMRFLMYDLGLNENRKTLKAILEKALPKTYQDVVLAYVVAGGLKEGEFRERHYFKKIYPQNIQGIEWSAIQVSTASGLCVILDLVLAHENEYRGFVFQERFSLTQFLDNRFAEYYV
jgi:saccharopine dehydrogenase-like NADP-dependent oxidoreductase